MDNLIEQLTALKDENIEQGFSNDIPQWVIDAIIWLLKKMREKL